MDSRGVSIRGIRSVLFPNETVFFNDPVRREWRERFLGLAKFCECGIWVVRYAGIPSKRDSANAGEVEPFVVEPVINPDYKYFLDGLSFQLAGN